MFAAPFEGPTACHVRSGFREKLKPAIRTVQSGQFWFKPENLLNFAQYLNRRLRGERSSAGSLLTVREQEIVCLIKRGLLTRQIATELGISDSTVKFHVSHILDKLGIQHRRGSSPSRPPISLPYNRR